MSLIARGYDGHSWILVDEHSVAVEEDRVFPPLRGYRGTRLHLVGGRAPHKESSSGFVFVEDWVGHQREFYPSVFDLRWTHVVSEGEA